MAEPLQVGDRILVTRMDDPGREHWVGMSGVVELVDDPIDDIYPVLVRLGPLEESFYFADTELRVVAHG